MTARQHRTVMVIGAGFDQVPLVQAAAARGYTVVAVDGNPRAPGFAHATHAHAVSTRDVAGILELARAYTLDAVTYMITETPLEAVFHLTRERGLPGPSWAAVQATVSKVAMRDLFAPHAIPNPPYAGFRRPEEALAAVASVGLPAVFKPTDSGHQKGLSLVNRPEDVPAAAAAALAASDAGLAIMEQYMPGPEINIIGLVQDGTVREAVVHDRIIYTEQAWGVAPRHLYPSRQPAAVQEQAVAITRDIVRALEIDNGVIFPQMIVTAEGPRVVEVGHRIPGGHVAEVVRYATGINLVEFQLDVSLGQARELEHYRTGPRYTGVVVDFLTASPGPLPVGRVLAIHGEAAARQLPGILECGTYNDPAVSTHVRPLVSGRDRFYYIIAGAGSADAAIACSQRAAGAIRVEVAPDAPAAQ